MPYNNVVAFSKLLNSPFNEKSSARVLIIALF